VLKKARTGKNDALGTADDGGFDGALPGRVAGFAAEGARR